MKTEAKKIKDFSIWDSVVNDKILQFEELEKKYKGKSIQLEVIKDENGMLREQNDNLNSQISLLHEEMSEKQKKIDELQRANDGLRIYMENIENSTSWKITKPIRVFLDSIRKNVQH